MGGPFRPHREENSGRIGVHRHADRRRAVFEAVGFTVGVAQIGRANGRLAVDRFSESQMMRLQLNGTCGPPPESRFRTSVHPLWPVSSSAFGTSSENPPKSTAMRPSRPERSRRRKSCSAMPMPQSAWLASPMSTQFKIARKPSLKLASSETRSRRNPRGRFPTAGSRCRDRVP